ncbi:SEC-C metal-binding domain-containing protein [Saccharibacillus deserti]|uniref:SEC-C metal-binding domain-containing protein n=1 Tax=Saccharibacillus deserti TaxID=1634444 RepID=UPI001FE6035A|nr:SEC-C metal-binding domain-containing protein [Saccharibacillus deserti]
MKIGRNDPCFCGSGKKYKKCCIEKEFAVIDSAKFASLKKADPAFAPRTHYVDRINDLNGRLQAEGRSEGLDADLMALAGDLLEDLESGRLHASTRYGEGFRPSERRLLEELANRVWGGLILGGFQERDVLRPLLAFASAALGEEIGEEAPIAGAVLTTDEAGGLLHWTLTPAVENTENGSKAGGFELTVETRGD